MKVTAIEGISEYRLENGVRLLLFPDPTKEVVTVNMTVFVGSRHEGYGEAGMAHLLEHMLFKGTPDHPDVPKVLQDRGARFNGTTWTDRTNYYATLPASEDNLEFALRLEADRLVNSLIRGEDLLSEMTVVRNEFEQGENSPIRILMQRMQSAAYDWHNYGKSTIGNRSDIERVPVVRLREFYRKFYRPDNTMVIIAGRFDPEKALELTQKYFGPLERPETPIDPTYTLEPPKDGERTVTLRRVGDVQLVGTAYHVPASSHEDFVAVRALTYVLGDEPSGRLYRGLVETELASNVYAFAYSFHDPGLKMTLVEVPEEQPLEKVRDELLRLIEEDLHENPITEAEVERAKQRILKQRELEAAETDRIAVALSDWAAQGDWRLYFLFRDRVEALTHEQVQAAAEKYLTRNNRTLGMFLPSETSQRVRVPDAPDLNQLLADYQGREEIEQGEAFDPDPRAIEERTERGELVEGIRYAWLPKKTRGGSVSLLLTLRYGTGETLAGRATACEVLPQLLERGTESLSYQELQDELTRLRAELSISGLPGLVQMRVKTRREQLPEVLALVRDIVRAPRLDAAELEVIRRQALTDLAASLNEPQALAPRAVRRALSPYSAEDVRYVPSLREEMDRYRALKLEDVRELYERFLSSQAGEVAVVGDFDPPAVQEQLAEALRGWKTDEPYVRVDRPAHPDVEGRTETIQTPDKSNAVYYASQQYPLRDDADDYPALLMGNFILGAGALSSRLGDRVRQQEGLSYGVRSGVSAASRDDRTDFTLFAISNPENKDRLIEVIEEEIQKLREKGVTEEELARAKEGHLQSERVRRTDSNYLAQLLVGSLFNERTMEFHEKQEAAIRELTVDQVNAAIQKYIDPASLLISVAGDFEAAPAAAGP